jgi:hypothetical protein
MAKRLAIICFALFVLLLCTSWFAGTDEAETTPDYTNAEILFNLFLGGERASSGFSFRGSSHFTELPVSATARFPHVSGEATQRLRHECCPELCGGAAR